MPPHRTIHANDERSVLDWENKGFIQQSNSLSTTTVLVDLLFAALSREILPHNYGSITE